jgi:pentatricopeptide repeat protein
VASDEWDSVLEVLDVFKRQNLTQERSSYRACLQACFESGNGVSAKEILNAMEKALVAPEPSDIALTVRAMCRNNIEQRGFWRKALSLIKYSSATITSTKKVIPVQAYDTVLECMKESREWKESVRLLRLMETGSAANNSTKTKEGGMHPAPEFYTYRTVIECCVETNQPEQAVQVLFSMKDRGVQVRY